jgi:hypothetical protein
VPVTHLFRRGDPDQPGEAVAPGGLTVLEPWDPLPLPAANPLPTTGRRLAFAEWLTDGKHPLTGRVLVNRVWMHHFGKGIVATPADFGALGDRPSHPELLDWLAHDFMAHGWRLKRLHRLILTSAAYRQASRRNPDGERLDPDNRLLGHMAVRRLDAEALRDALLAVSGRLRTKMGGPPVPVRLDEVGQAVLGIDTNDSAGRPTGKVAPLNGEEYRRSVYVQMRRSRPLAFLDAFDEPVMAPNCPARPSATVTPQALMLMNSPFILDHARDFAGRVRREAGDEPRAQVHCAWRLAFGREPAEGEAKDALAFLAAQAEQFRAHPPAQDAKAAAKPEPQQEALASWCQALLSTNEFLYVD